MKIKNGWITTPTAEDKMSSEYTVFIERDLERVIVCENSERFALLSEKYELSMVRDLTPEQLEDLAFNILQVVAYWRPDSESAKALELVGRMDGGPRLEK